MLSRHRLFQTTQNAIFIMNACVAVDMDEMMTVCAGDLNNRRLSKIIDCIIGFREAYETKKVEV